MNPLVKALKITINFLEKQNIDYMVIGGIANSIYGNPRQTFDIDIKIAVDDNRLKDFIMNISSIGKPVPEDPLKFVKETAVIPVDIADVRVDFIRATLPYEWEAIKRGSKKNLFGVSARVTSVEDLIIQKSISTRLKDWSDINEIVKFQKTVIDWDYLLKHISDLAGFLTDPTIYERMISLKDEE